MCVYTPFSVILVHQMTTPNGLVYKDNAISVAEEKKLMEFIDDPKSKSKWSKFKDGRKTRHFGKRYGYADNLLHDDAELMPELFVELCARVTGWKPEQGIVNNYEPGEGISAHVDGVDLFDGEVCSISLLSACDMVFKRGTSEYVQRLKGRSSVLLTQDSRYKWTHSIPHRKKEPDGYVRGRRVSITFRRLKKNCIEHQISPPNSLKRKHEKHETKEKSTDAMPSQKRKPESSSDVAKSPEFTRYDVDSKEAKELLARIPFGVGGTSMTYFQHKTAQTAQTVQTVQTVQRICIVLSPFGIAGLPLMLPCTDQKETWVLINTAPELDFADALSRNFEKMTALSKHDKQVSLVAIAPRSTVVVVSLDQVAGVVKLNNTVVHTIA